MAILIEPIELELTAAQFLTGYGAGALIYIYSSATETGTFSLVDTVAIVSGTEVYSLWDDAGTDTTWYRTRIGNAVADDFSGYGGAFQVGTSETNAYVTPELLKDRMAITDNLDDVVLWPICDEVNDEIHGEIGFFLGPSDDTTRTFDGRDAKPDPVTRRGWSRLWIPGGIRALTAVSIGYTSNDTSTSGTVADFLLGPLSHTTQPGQPYGYVEIIYPQSGSVSYFPPYQRNVLLTGSFGYARSPSDVVGVAVALATRKWQARSTGGRNIATLDNGSTPVYPFLTGPEMGILHAYRWAKAA